MSLEKYLDNRQQMALLQKQNLSIIAQGQYELDNYIFHPSFFVGGVDGIQYDIEAKFKFYIPVFQNMRAVEISMNTIYANHEISKVNTGIYMGEYQLREKESFFFSHISELFDKLSSSEFEKIAQEMIGDHQSMLIDRNISMQKITDHSFCDFISLMSKKHVETFITKKAHLFDNEITTSQIKSMSEAIDDKITILLSSIYTKKTVDNNVLCQESLDTLLENLRPSEKKYHYHQLDKKLKAKEKSSVKKI